MTRLLPIAALLLALVACRQECPECSAPEAAPAPAGEKPWRLGYPIIDSHVHIVPTMEGLALALAVFEAAGIDRFAVKSAGPWGSPRFEASVAMKQVLGDRVELFCNIPWSRIDEPGFAQEIAAELEKAAGVGVKGVKIFKALGLSVKTAGGALVPVDDPRLDPIFEAVGRLNMILAIHTADPVAFFEPVTPENERWDELKEAPDWSFYGDEYPTHEELLAQRNRRIARHPGTTFLLIHLANHPEDLGDVDRLLDAYPNVYVDTSARVPEFGRHPADEVRAFFIKHQDRILFGSDFIVAFGGKMQLGSVSPTPPGPADAVEFFRRHWEYFESDGVQIEHPTPIQGRWKVDAIHLPPEVLRKLYHDNADKLIWQRELTVTAWGGTP
ncbi:MAG: amidohydrolase family protein [Pseudomonadota bacterium]